MERKGRGGGIGGWRRVREGIGRVGVWLRERKIKCVGSENECEGRECEWSREGRVRISGRGRVEGTNGGANVDGKGEV